jgi:hypothetical protein
MIIHEGRFYLEKGEQCETCKHFYDLNCSLIQLFGQGYLDPVEPFTITNCGTYAKKERRLKAV